MGEFLKSLGSLSWWLSVVIVGILINLASGYIKPALDRYLLRTSSWWRKRSSERLARREEELEYLLKDSDERVMVAFEGIRQKIQSLMYMFAASIAVFAGSFSYYSSDRGVFTYFILALGVFYLYSFSKSHFASFRASNTLKELRYRKDNPPESEAILTQGDSPSLSAPASPENPQGELK